MSTNPSALQAPPADSTVTNNQAPPVVKTASRNLPQSEYQAARYAKKLLKYVQTNNGLFTRDELGTLYLILNGRRIPLNSGSPNVALAGLMLDACGVSTLTSAAQAAIQRLQVEVARQAGQTQFRRFATLVEQKRLYIPVGDGRLLQRITEDQIDQVPNGMNTERLWLEHPNEQPIQLTFAETPLGGLEAFERLLVNSQACRIPAMRWFVAMHEGLFPFVRDTCPARFLMNHVGPTQQGKTSGAQRFTKLHGLGEVKGDYSVAAFANTGDIGLLVMDNKEQANFTQPLIDFCLFLATGAERGRSLSDGSMRVGSRRPVGVITTIEGVWKNELKTRCVEVQYGVTGPKIGRGPIEREIEQRRSEITCALFPVLQRFLKIAEENRLTPIPLPDFEEHFTALCNLLRAYGDIAEKPVDWAESVIQEWASVLTGRETEEDDLEYPLLSVFDQVDSEDGTGGITAHAVTWEGKAGTLYVAECGRLLMRLQKLNLRDLPLPRNATGLGRRLRSPKFRALVLLNEDSAPALPMLKRSATSRPVGFFREVSPVSESAGGGSRCDDSVTGAVRETIQ
jgi:hypothetical protein